MDEPSRTRTPLVFRQMPVCEKRPRIPYRSPSPSSPTVETKSRKRSVVILLSSKAAAAPSRAASPAPLSQMPGARKRPPLRSTLIRVPRGATVSKCAVIAMQFLSSPALSPSRFPAESFGHVLRAGGFVKGRRRYFRQFDMDPVHPLLLLLDRAQDGFPAGKLDDLRQGGNFWETHAGWRHKNYTAFKIAAFPSGLYTPEREDRSYGNARNDRL